MNTSLKVLLAEDNDLIAEALMLRLNKAVTSLKKPPLQITRVTTLRETIALAGTFESNVTLLDPNLKDTLDWTESIHAIPLIRKPVIVITGMDDPERKFKLECFKYGAQHVFYKPWEMPVVEHIIAMMADAALRKVMPEKLEEPETPCA